MTQERQWKCVSKGKAWTFMKLSVILLLLVLGVESYLMRGQAVGTLGGLLRFHFVAAWSGAIGIIAFGFASAGLLTRAMTTCREGRAFQRTGTRLRRRTVQGRRHGGNVHDDGFLAQRG